MKWKEVVKDLKKDDVVLILDPKLPRGRWPLGRMTETYPGQDGHTRVAKLSTQQKLYLGPSTNWCLYKRRRELKHCMHKN